MVYGFLMAAVLISFEGGLASLKSLLNKAWHVLHLVAKALPPFSPLLVKQQEVY